MYISKLDKIQYIQYVAALTTQNNETAPKTTGVYRDNHEIGLNAVKQQNVTTVTFITAGFAS